MLLLGKAVTDVESGRNLYDRLIASGKALEKMREIIEAQQGNPRVIDDYTLMPKAAHERRVLAGRSGYVRAIDTEAVGRACMLLGAGRARLDTPIDASVGLEIRARIGDEVTPESELAVLYFNDPARADEAAPVVTQAYAIAKEPVSKPSLIKDVLR
jgi:pyrimidine-nucleoside phosphorylase